jgi:hypothetical protein
MTMIDLTVRTLEASAKTIPLDTVASLRSKLRGTVALPGDDGYDTARTIWKCNGLAGDVFADSHSPRDPTRQCWRAT